MRSRSFAFMLLMSTALTGCATFKPPLICYDDEQPAVLQTDPPKPVQVVERVLDLVALGHGHPLQGVVIFGDGLGWPPVDLPRFSALVAQEGLAHDLLVQRWPASSVQPAPSMQT